MAKPASFAQATLLALALALAGCVTEPPLQIGRYIKGIAQPGRWKEFLAQAERGQIEEIRDEPIEPSLNVHWIDRQFGQVGATHSRGAIDSEIFKGKFRLEAKTSYARARKETATDIESLLNALP